MGHAFSRITGRDIGGAISGCEYEGQEGNSEMRMTYIMMRT